MNETTEADPSPDRCATCAYRSGTDASRTPTTVMLARLCVLSGEPFSCHERPDVCAGHAAAVASRQKAGIVEPEWRRLLYLEMSEVLVDAANGPALSDAEAAAVVRGIVDRVGEQLEVPR